MPPRTRKTITAEDFDAASEFDTEPSEPTQSKPAPTARFQQPAPAPAQPAEPTDELPSDLKAAFALLTRLDNEQPSAVRSLEFARRERLQKVRNHVFNLQQPPPPPVMDANTFAAMAVAHNAQHAIRSARIEELRAKLNH